jgi:predicted dinucleotide-binding enzyme
MTGMTDLPRVAVLGAGHSGPVIARALIEAGYEVSIAASGDRADIALIASVLVPGARPRWAADAVADADLVVLAIPIHRFADFDPALVAGKVVVDVMNYWPPVDGVQVMFEERPESTSEIVRRRLAGSTVVKTLNHIGYHEIDEDDGPPDRPSDARSAWLATASRGRHRRRHRQRMASTACVWTACVPQLFEAGGPVFGHRPEPFQAGASSRSGMTGER